MICQIMRALTASLAFLLMIGTAPATLIVDPPQQITKQVTVQLIQTALDNGTSPATVFGNATQRADIEAGIDSIWAQAGIDINILPTITHYNNTFAYQGSVSPRPTSDLNTIFTNAGGAGVLNSDPLTLNLIMVNVVPGNSLLTEFQSAGIAWVGGNGITGFVGDNLLTSDNNHDIIAGVMAHEIGHNLGLGHTANGIANLMSPGGTSQQLTPSQIITAKSSNFARVYTPPLLAGDYNGNGVVDGADYVVWRNSNIGTYAEWRSHFGATGGTGSLLVGNGANVLPGGDIGAVPELNSIVYLLIALPFLVSRHRRTSP